VDPKREIVCRVLSRYRRPRNTTSARS